MKQLKLTTLEKSIVLEDVFRKMMCIEDELLIVQDSAKKIGIARRRLILSKLGFNNKRIEELKRLASRPENKLHSLK